MLISPVFAVEDGCWNKDRWGANRQSKFFTKDAIIPNRWPLTKWTVKESMDKFYPNGFTARNTEVGPCAQYSCTRGPGKVGFFTVADKANPNVCQCTVKPKNLCNGMKVFVVSDPAKTSGPSGSRMPDFPDPVYPSEWDTKFYYKGKYTGDLANIKPFLLSKVPSALKDSKTTITVCNGIDIRGSGNKIGNIRKYVINNVKTVRQSFSQWYSAWSWTQDFGVCGNKVWSWREGRHMDAVQERVNHKIPVEVLFPKWIETIKSVIRGCPNGLNDPSNPGKCIARVSGQSQSDCPSGYLFTYKPFGGSFCSRSNLDMAKSCSSGFLTEDTSTSPSTWTCVDGSFSNPDLQDVNICGARGKVAVPVKGDYDGSFTLEKNLDRKKEVSGETKPPPWFAYHSSNTREKG